MEGSMQEGEELEHPWLDRSIESAQEEGRAAEFLRSQAPALRYNDVLNQQREVI